MTTSGTRPIRIGLGIAVILAVAYGLITIEPPKVQRMKSNDADRVQHLSNLSGNIQAFWRQKERLPEDLEELSQWVSLALVIRDPWSGEPYGYNIDGERTYQLCATFEMAAPEDETRAPKWSHPEGHHCFSLEVFDKDR